MTGVQRSIACSLRSMFSCNMLGSGEVSGSTELFVVPAKIGQTLYYPVHISYSKGYLPVADITKDTVSILMKTINWRSRLSADMFIDNMRYTTPSKITYRGNCTVYSMSYGLIYDDKTPLLVLATQRKVKADNYWSRYVILQDPTIVIHPKVFTDNKYKGLKKIITNYLLVSIPIHLQDLSSNPVAVPKEKLEYTSIKVTDEIENFFRIPQVPTLTEDIDTVMQKCLEKGLKQGLKSVL